jgi:hypothetical protein
LEHNQLAIIKLNLMNTPIKQQKLGGSNDSLNPIIEDCHATAKGKNHQIVLYIYRLNTATSALCDAIQYRFGVIVHSRVPYTNKDI